MLASVRHYFFRGSHKNLRFLRQEGDRIKKHDGIVVIDQMFDYRICSEHNGILTSCISDRSKICWRHRKSVPLFSIRSLEENQQLIYRQKEDIFLNPNLEHFAISTPRVGLINVGETLFSLYTLKIPWEHEEETWIDDMISYRTEYALQLYVGEKKFTREPGYGWTDHPLKPLSIPSPYRGRITWASSQHLRNPFCKIEDLD